MPAWDLLKTVFRLSNKTNALVLLLRYTLFTWSYHSSGRDNALAAANCRGRNMPLSILLLKRRTSLIIEAFPASRPTRQPAILWDLLKEFSSTAVSFASFTDKRLNGSSLRMKE